MFLLPQKEKFLSVHVHCRNTGNTEKPTNALSIEVKGVSTAVNILQGGIPMCPYITYKANWEIAGHGSLV